MIVVIAWIAVALMGVVVATQVGGWTGRREIAAVQALTPYVLAPAIPISVLALATRYWALAAAAGAVSLALAILCWPLMFPAGQPAPVAGSKPLRVFHGNLLYVNRRTGDIPAVLAGLDADVLTFTEYTAEQAAIFLASPLAGAYPYRIEHPAPGPAGSAIWSRYPLPEIAMPDWRYRPSAAVVLAPDPVTLFVVHPLSPIVSAAGWYEELGHLMTIGRDVEGPIVMIGDFNAAYWHPQYRRLLNVGWRDAHQATGHGFATSWPTDVTLLPPYVLIDHALVNDGLVVTAVTDVDVPGSDHRGFLVDVAVADLPS